MVDLSPLLELYIKFQGHAAELRHAYYDTEEGSVTFFIKCKGGVIDAFLQIDQGKNGSTHGLNIVLWPAFGKSQAFDFSHVDQEEKFQEKLQDELSMSSLMIQDTPEGKRQFGFRRLELLEPGLDFVDQDLDRILVVLAAMIYEVEELFPILVAYHEGRKEIYGHMLLTESAPPGLQ